LPVYDAIIGDDRAKNAFGLLMSLSFLIETAGALITPVRTASAGSRKPA
jgi:hypothetical protein